MEMTGESLLDIGNINLSHVAQKRKAGIPLEYIIGKARFGGLLLHCSSSTVIPTEYTTLLVDVTLELIKKRQHPNQTVIEVGTGCGNVAVYLAKKSGNLMIIASDVSPEALKVARKNVNRYKLKHSIRLICGDLFEPFRELGYKENIDLVICNPPYIPTASVRKLSPEISNHQPRIALDGGPYGVSFFQRLANGAASILKPGGALIFEIGAGQEKFVTWILNRHGSYQYLEYHKDHAGTVRVISAQKVAAPRLLLMNQK